ncbi:hypothetical protein, partial [Pseudomonas kitaguniensis]|uniref:hypothetical protein n=1 Tax=Pseudomonas kitaguniensis TaxID=2607908 RepID=UPI003D093291
QCCVHGRLQRGIIRLSFEVALRDPSEFPSFSSLQNREPFEIQDFRPSGYSTSNTNKPRIYGCAAYLSNPTS